MDLFYHETFVQSEQMPMQLRLHRGQINYMILEHWHRSIEMDYLLDCEADFYMNGKKKAVSAGSITLINSGDIHAWSQEKCRKIRGMRFTGFRCLFPTNF